MVVVNNVLQGCYRPRVGPQETLFTCILYRLAEGVEVKNNVLPGCYRSHVGPQEMLFTILYRLAEGVKVKNNVLQGCYGSHVGPQEMLFTCILRRVAEGNGGGEQCAAGPLLATCETQGGALYL